MPDKLQSHTKKLFGFSHGKTFPEDTGRKLNVHKSTVSTRLLYP